MERAIIHLNITDFSAAVETNLQPSLKGYPFIVAPLGAPRAVVYDMSDEAYKQGIRKGMPLAKAVRLNRKIKTIPPRFNRYEQVMKDLIKHTTDFTPLIEYGTADGHIFMDVTRSGRLFGPPPDMAFRLEKTFKKQFGLDPVWSVATNKLVAKVATRVAKPYGEYIVAPGEEESLLTPLPVKLVPGIIKSDLEKLMAFNLYYVYQARNLTLEQLGIPFDERAFSIYNFIRGRDTAPVRTFHSDSTRIKADHEFGNDTNDAGCLRKAVYQMVETTCTHLRRKQMNCSAVKIILSYSDGLQSSARKKFSPSSACEMTLFKRSTDILETAWKRRVRVRHICLICEKTVPKPVQAELFSSGEKQNRRKKLSDALEKIRSKFGKKAVSPALTLVRERSLA